MRVKLLPPDLCQPSELLYVGEMLRVLSWMSNRLVKEGLTREYFNKEQVMCTRAVYKYKKFRGCQDVRNPTVKMQPVGNISLLLLP